MVTQRTVTSSTVDLDAIGMVRPHGLRDSFFSFYVNCTSPSFVIPLTMPLRPLTVAHLIFSFDSTRASPSTSLPSTAPMASRGWSRTPISQTISITALTRRHGGLTLGARPRFVSRSQLSRWRRHRPALPRAHPRRHPVGIMAVFTTFVGSRSARASLITPNAPFPKGQRSMQGMPSGMPMANPMMGNMSQMTPQQQQQQSEPCSRKKDGLLRLRRASDPLASSAAAHFALVPHLLFIVVAMMMMWRGQMQGKFPRRRCCTTTHFVVCLTTFFLSLLPCTFSIFSGHAHAGTWKVSSAQAQRAICMKRPSAGQHLRIPHASANTSRPLRFPLQPMGQHAGDANGEYKSKSAERQ